MKKKGMFITSILLCVAMIMTNFAGLGNSIAMVKAVPTEYDIKFGVNDVSIGEVRGGIIDQENEGNYILKTDPVPGLTGVEGDRVLLSVRYKDYKDDIYKIKEWKITPESGSIEEKNGHYIYTIGTENVEIQAIFEEKGSYTVSMEDWIYGKGEKKPTYIDENGDTVTVEEVVYFVNETCNEGTYEEPKDETTPKNSGAEDIGRAPVKPGKYYAKFMLFGGDNYKTEYVILPFCIRETVEITPNNIEIPYVPEENTYPVAELFEIPENAGDRTYSIVSQSSEQGVGTGTIEEDNNLTITKCGKFKIKVTTAQTDKAVTGSAIAVLTVNPAVFSNDTTSLILEDEVYAYSGSLCSPVLTVTYGETELTEGVDYEIDTTESTIEAKDVGIYPVRIKGIGNYTGFLSTEWKIKDSTAPTISISGENDEDVYYGPVSITVSDDNLSLVTLIKDDEQQNIEINNGSATINITDLGEYTLVAFDEEENYKEYNFAIAQKEISITGQNKDITYDATKPYDLSGLFTVSDTTLIPEYSIVKGSGTGSISESGLTITKTGTFTIKAIIAEGTYNTYAEDTAVLTVEKANGNISVTISDVTYGTPVNPSVSSTTNTGSRTIVYTGKAPTVYESSSTAPIGTGTYTATITYTATDLYNVVEESVDFEITPATLTVKANDLSKKVETADPELTYTVDGLKYDDKATDVLSGKLARVSGETLGDYNIVKGDLTANQNYTISFTGATFTITEKDRYDVSVEKSIEAAGTVTGVGNYEEGSSVTLTATANPGYKFIEWQENNTKVGDNNTYSFTVSADKNIKAVFAEKNTPALSITVNPQWIYGDSSDGKISFSGNTENGTETIVYYIDSDYTIKTNATNSGAESEGGIPKFANTYYVKYSIGETVNYKAATTQTSFIINGKSISNCTLSLDHTSFDYVVGTTSYSPLLTVKDGETSLNEGNDYEIVADQSTTSASTVGSYTIKINGKGNYTGSASVNWTVNDITAPLITGVDKETNYGAVTVNVSDDFLSSVTIKKNMDALATELDIINHSASKTVTELGSYIVTATDQAGNVSTCSFTIAQEVITITAKTAVEDTTITYAPSATFDVSNLFEIPQNSGTATYSVIASTVEGAGAGTLGTDKKTLTITKAGTITIKVNTAGSTYVASAEQTATLLVNKATITSDMFFLNKSSYDYVVGESCTPVLTVKEGINLIKGTDYEIDTTSTQSASEVGTYTIKVNGKGNYTDSVSYTWKIEKTDNTNPVIEGVINGNIYNRKVTVSVSDANLSTVTIKKDSNEATNISVSNGTASKEISDLGSYTVTATDKAGNVTTCSFTIAKEIINIIAKTEETDTTITYTPSATFDVSSLFEIPQNAGTATYSIVASTAEGTGEGILGTDNKTLTITKAGTITIKVNTVGSEYVAVAEKTATLLVNRATITKNMLSLDKSSFDYVEGTTSYLPNLTVKDGETTLIADTDYEIDTNASIESASTVGTYIIKVNGKGNYTGSESIEWEVKDITKPVISGVEDNSTHYGPVTFNVSDDYLASVTVKKDTNEEVSITINNGAVSQNVTDLGSYTITATDNAGNVSTCSFIIAQEVITLNAKTEAKDTTFTYDPNTIFDVSSLFNDILEKAGTVSYSIVPSETEGAGAGTLGEDGKTLTVTKAGIITIKVNTSGSTYVAPAEATASFTVKKAKGNINVTINNVTYGTAVNPIVSSTTNTGNYSIVYKNNAITNDAIASNIPVEVGSYTATVTYPENDLYEKVEESVDFTITPATLTVVANNIIKKVESKDPELTYAVNGLQYNDTVTNVISGKLVRSTGEDAGKEYPILQGDLKANKNYTISFTGATFTITPKDIYTVSIEKNINEAGDVTGSGNYVEGSEVTLTATANSGYKFVEWQGKETKAKVSDLSSFKYTVSSNRNLVAVFEKKKDLTLTLTAVSGTYGDSNIGDVTLKVFDGDETLNIFDEKAKVITEYFTDESCSIKTNTINGADTEGGVPKFVGTYYVNVTVPETENYNSASVKASFTINASEPGPGPEPGPEPETNTQIWTKGSVDWVANFNDDSKTAKATFHLKDNSTPANSVSVDADNIVVVMFLDGTQKTFKATLKYNGYEFEDETTVKMHTEHEWVVSSWDWTGTTYQKGSAKATFKCSKSGQEHQKILSASVHDKSRTDNKVVFIAKVTGPDDKTYTSTYTVIKNADNTETGKEGDGIEIGNGIVIIGLEDEYDYTGKQIKPAFQVIDENRNDAVLALNVDYTVKYGANKDTGEKAGTIEVKGKGNYTGAATSATFAIVNRRAELSEDEQKELVNLKGASVRISEKFTYTGSAQYPKSFELKLKGGSWIKYDTEDGITYTDGDNELKAVVTFSNNVNKGTATMLIEGAADDKGRISSVKKNFSIKAADLKDAKFADDMEGTYTVKGAKPDKLVVTWQANDDSEVLTLVEGQDFKVKYSNNKAAGTGKIVITGKGNFTKKAEGGTFKINPMKVEKDDISVVVSDKTAANKVNVTILDAEGNALNQKKQLNVTVKDEEGTDLGKNKVKSGDKIIVNVKSKDTNNVIIDEADIDVEVLVGMKLSKAKVAVNGYSATYTGVPVELNDEAFNTIKVTINGKELKIHEDFEIAGYKNNTNKGTMTVTIRGIENTSEGATPVSGTKTFKVKVNPKPLNANN